jgi:anaerobic ribonucleoside-triphosphate reductase activating protein
MKEARADALRVGGVQRFTTLDYPGAFAAVVFVQGCPWRCLYCHNPHLQSRVPPPGVQLPWHELRDWFDNRRGRLDAVVFSGGEPTLDPALPDAMRDVRALGLRVGLHTAGMLPLSLRRVLPLVDWVGLDIKAPLDDDALHTQLTGAKARRSSAAVAESLHLLVESGIEFECRTTAHGDLLAPGRLEQLGQSLASLGVRHYALQGCRIEGRAPSASDGERLRAAAQSLRPLFERVECRLGD